MPRTKQRLLRYAEDCVYKQRNLVYIVPDGNEYDCLSNYRDWDLGEKFAHLTPNESALFILLVIEAEELK